MDQSEIKPLKATASDLIGAVDPVRPPGTKSPQSLTPSPTVPSASGFEQTKEPLGIREWKEWNSSGSKESFSKLVKAMEPTLNSVVRANPKLNPSLMRSKAKTLLLNAAKTYDPDTGASFSTHVHNHLKPLTIRAHGETRAIAKGRFVEEAARDYKKVFDEFSEDHMREPTADEMADRMRISRDRSSELMRRIFSYEIPEGSMEGGVIPEENTAENKRLRLWTEYVYQGLSDRDKLIMDYRLGRNGKPQLGLNDIAKKVGVSTTMVHKVLKRTTSEILDGISYKMPPQSAPGDIPDLPDNEEDLLPNSGNQS